MCLHLHVIYKIHMDFTKKHALKLNYSHRSRGYLGYETYFKPMVTKPTIHSKYSRCPSMKRKGVIGHSCQCQLTKWPPLKKSCLLHTSFFKIQNQLNILKSSKNNSLQLGLLGLLASYFFWKQLDNKGISIWTKFTRGLNKASILQNGWLSTNLPASPIWKIPIKYLE